MKRAFLFIFAIFAALILIPKKESTRNVHEMYLLDHEFQFMVTYDPSDTCFKRKIYSMIDQEYDGYSIHIIIDEKWLSEIDAIQTYAKKMDKSHLIKVIPRADDKPYSLIKEEIIETFNPNHLVVELGVNCLFADTETLGFFNSVYKQALEPQSLYSNFTSLPSYQENKAEIEYKDSALKVYYAKSAPSSIHFIEMPLYFKVAR